MYKIFQKEIDYIQNSEIKSLIIDIIKKAPKYFYDPECWSSSSGKYHLQSDGKRENLIIHTKRVVRVMMDLLRNPIYNQDLSKDDMDCCIGACLLHDLCKYGLSNEKGEFTKFEHPLLVKHWVKLTEANKGWNENQVKFFFKIDKLIESHSGNWNTSKYSDIVLPKPETKEAELVHFSDYVASRDGYNIQVD